MNVDLPRSTYLGVIPCLIIFLLSSSSHALSQISVSRQVFNPSLNESTTIRLNNDQPGELVIQIIDRDGCFIRTIYHSRVTPGVVEAKWDGRDSLKRVVPNEAYSIQARLSTESKDDIYFPANYPQQLIGIPATFYDRVNGILGYHLMTPSRVHILAGSFKFDGKTKLPIGPVLKTIANREPRVAGAVVESWNGFDESGTIKVSELPNFKISIVAEPLPENVIITTGNDSISFLKYAIQREGRSLFTYSSKNHILHSGLRSLDDVSPSLAIDPVNAEWIASEQAWRSSRNEVVIYCKLSGENAKTFAKLPGKLSVYVNDAVVASRRTPTSELSFRIKANLASRGVQIVAVNWDTDYGPIAVNSFRLKFNGSPNSSTAITQERP